MAGLRDLDASTNPSLGEGSGAAFQPLAGAALAGGLTRLSLSACRLQRVPRQLSGLGALAKLDLRNNNFAVADQQGEVFRPLQSLGALTLLSLKSTSGWLAAVPPQLAAVLAGRAGGVTWQATDLYPASLLSAFWLALVGLPTHFSLVLLLCCGWRRGRRPARRALPTSLLSKYIPAWPSIRDRPHCQRRGRAWTTTAWSQQLGQKGRWCPLIEPNK